MRVRCDTSCRPPASRREAILSCPRHRTLPTRCCCRPSTVRREVAAPSCSSRSSRAPQPTRRLVYAALHQASSRSPTVRAVPCRKVRELKVSAPAPTAAGASPELGKTREPSAANRRNATGRESADPDDGETEHAATCLKLQATLDSLDSRMRTGYSAREAGRLWNAGAKRRPACTKRTVEASGVKSGTPRRQVTRMTPSPTLSSRC